MLNYDGTVRNTNITTTTEATTTTSEAPTTTTTGFFKAGFIVPKTPPIYKIKTLA